MTSGPKPIATALLGLCLLTASYSDVTAKRLSSVACTRLVNEHAELGKGDIETVMNTDPNTTPAELKEEQLTRIERFLFIEGQIRFRCPEIKLPGLGVPKPSKAQAAKMEKKHATEIKKKRAAKLEKKKAADLKKKLLKKGSGPGVPLPDRNPKR